MATTIFKSHIFKLSLFFLCIATLKGCEYTPFAKKTDPVLAQSENPDRSLLLIDKAGNPTASLEALLHLFDIEPYWPLESIVKKTQEKWLRTPGKERWEIQEGHGNKKNETLTILNDLGIILAVNPKKHQFEYGIILGATVSRVRTRLNYLVTLWNEGVRFNQLVFLGGARPLDANLESSEILLNTHNELLPTKSSWQLKGELPTTETEMMKLVYDQAVLSKELENVPVTFIDTPLIETANGTKRRPNTGDTIASWLAQRRSEGDTLFISNNPYVGYQDAVVRYYMPQDAYIETVGPEADKNELISIYLDTIARNLYQENLRRTKK